MFCPGALNLEKKDKEEIPTAGKEILFQLELQQKN